VDFTIEERLAGRLDHVVETLLDPGYVAARADLPKLGDPELVELTRDGDRARQRVRLRFTAPLSAAVLAVVDPDKLTWVDDATWDLAARRAEHTIVPEHYRDRLRCTYVETLTPTDEGGTRRVLSGMLRVKVMLVAGKVEHAIVSGLREYATAETALLDRLTGSG
jgi:hypothetical protein